MTSDEVQLLVHKTLDVYVYNPRSRGSTVGVRWSAEKVYQYLDRLRSSLVQPTPKKVRLSDTVVQMKLATPQYADVWVVAEFNHIWLFFNPATSDFGLARKSNVSDEFVTFGVRGDLVGVYCAA